ncbi:hypothetical protein OVA26_11650 [Microbacterium sp. SL62]|uniref:hypothetical protein n=1 Tax=Microbacterium sp. SL62 TaxID=2995139 RepID=UPI002275E93D|nr:hypothetical protein [Microbacterium sp. SL62]MCY1717597.1 hypothetical protein [Microbacterium sp. SL62]
MMNVEYAFAGSASGTQTRPVSVVMSVTEDDASIWLSCFREAIQSLGVGSPLRDKVGASRAELDRGMRLLQTYPKIRGKQAARHILMNAFALSSAEEKFVHRNLRATARSIGILSLDTSAPLLLTTLKTLQVSLSCAHEMVAYLWPQEVHAITGYDPPEIRRFVSSLTRCRDIGQLMSWG